MAIKPFNSVAGFSVGEIPANVVLANGDIITGNIQANANIVANGNITATYFLGNGAYLTGIDATSIQNGNSNVKVYANANVEISSAGNANVVTITGTGLIVAGTVSASGNAIVGNLSTVGNVNSGNLITTGLLSAIGNANVGNIGATAGVFTTVEGTLTTAAQPNITSVGALASLSVIGNANIGNIGTGGLITAVGNIGAGNISTGGLLTVTGNANIGNIGTAGLITASGNIQGANLVTGGVLSVTGNANIGNIGTAGEVTAVGNGTFGNLITGGTISATGNANVANLNTTGVFATTLSASANANVGNLGTAGLITATGNIGGGNIVTGGVVTATGNITGGNLVTGGVVSATGNITGGNLSITGTSTLPDIVGANITTASNANLNIEPNGTGLVVIANTAGGATAIAMGDPTQGNLVSNAVTLSNSSSVSNAIAQLNLVLGKLVPPAPPTFPASQSISIQSLSTYRMANYTQTDNTPGANKSVAGGTTVTTVRRASSYTTGNITVAGPGDTGTITAFLNGADAGNRALTANLDGNGTYSNLVIYNNYDYANANANITRGFWSVFSSRAAGTVTEGWNEVYIADSAASNSNTANWFYDSSTPGTPTFSSTGISAPGSPSYAYSSTVPHYDNTNAFDVTFNVNRLSGNMYPTSDTFVTGSAGGAFGAPVSVTYSTAGVATPLAQNLYVSSGSQAVATTSTIISGFGASSTGPGVSVTNSYNTGTNTFSPGANVLYKTGTTSSASRIEEANVYVGSTIGSGSGLAYRIVNPGSGNTPTFTGSEAAFNSQSSTLQAYDATVVANILKHDQTNYSTGYLPVGPNLSSGRGSAQYFTIKIVRTSVSKFDVKWTGNIAGLWVALPGSTIDSTSGANGWVDMSVAYAGSGVPGSNTGAGGNGSDGCALGGVAPLNSAQTNKSVTATFGTVSSSSTVTNEIYIRIALTSGQSVTALSLQTASN